MNIRELSLGSLVIVEIDGIEHGPCEVVKLNADTLTVLWGDNLMCAKHDKVILVSSVLACIVSCIFFYVPFLSEHVSQGFAIIIAAVIAALAGVIARRKLEGRAGTVTAIVLGAVLVALLAVFAPSYEMPETTEVAFSGANGSLDGRIFVPLLIVMAVTTYLVRMIPFTLFRKKLEKPSIKAFFDYIPYWSLYSSSFIIIFFSFFINIF